VATIFVVVGGALVLCELFFGSFFLLFVGAAFLTCAVAEACGVFVLLAKVVGESGGMAARILCVAILSGVFVKFFRPMFLRWFAASEAFEENANLKEGGTGIVARGGKNGLVRLNGTLWKADLTGHNEGDVVEVKFVKNNRAILV